MIIIIIIVVVCRHFGRVFGPSRCADVGHFTAGSTESDAAATERLFIFFLSWPGGCGVATSSFMRCSSSRLMA